MDQERTVLPRMRCVKSMHFTHATRTTTAPPWSCNGPVLMIPILPVQLYSSVQDETPRRRLVSLHKPTPCALNAT